MEQKTGFQIPPVLLILDVLGGVLLAFGAVKYFANIDIIPSGLLVENYEIYFIVVGILMMLPMIGYIILKAKPESGTG